MTRYWQFLIVGIICLLAALLWARPRSLMIPRAMALTATVALQKSAAGNPDRRPTPTAPANDKSRQDLAQGNADDPLPGSSSSLPLLAVIGFGVLAGGITSAMRTR
jgi:hypothetical protein